MNTLKNTALIATVATLFVLQAASASTAGHRMPADYTQAQPSYQLKINAPAVVGVPLVVTLINQADGKVVQNGDIAVMRPVFAGQKASPMIRYVPVMLTRAADGSFVCAGEHHVAGEELTLRGAGPGDAAPVWLTLTVKG
ncbi:MAG: hypothetical protein P4L57_08310 [Rhizomicrobium sp.]|nr:hypothetical protein [Rhizomicrobium sp.]